MWDWYEEPNDTATFRRVSAALYDYIDGRDDDEDEETLGRIKDMMELVEMRGTADEERRIRLNREVLREVHSYIKAFREIAVDTFTGVGIKRISEWTDREYDPMKVYKFDLTGDILDMRGILRENAEGGPCFVPKPFTGARQPISKNERKAIKKLIPTLRKAQEDETWTDEETMHELLEACVDVLVLRQGAPRHLAFHPNDSKDFRQVAYFLRELNNETGEVVEPEEYETRFIELLNRIVFIDLHSSVLMRFQWVVDLVHGHFIVPTIVPAALDWKNANFPEDVLEQARAIKDDRIHAAVKAVDELAKGLPFRSTVGLEDVWTPFVPFVGDDEEPRIVGEDIIDRVYNEAREPVVHIVDDSPPRRRREPVVHEGNEPQPRRRLRRRRVIVEDDRSESEDEVIFIDQALEAHRDYVCAAAR